MRSDNARFLRASRLLNKPEFDRVFREGRRCASKAPFALIGLANGLGHPRLGLAISKRRVRRAVDRNRIKRVAREAFRIAGLQLPAHDLVLIATRDVAEWDPGAQSIAVQALWSSVQREFLRSCA